MHDGNTARMEGKDYVMQDGDVVEFRFNVLSRSGSTSEGSSHSRPLHAALSTMSAFGECFRGTKKRHWVPGIESAVFRGVLCAGLR